VRNQLKSCAQCGGTPEFHDVNLGSKLPGTWIECKCGMQTQICRNKTIPLAEVKALAVWNRRVER